MTLLQTKPIFSGSKDEKEDDEEDVWTAPEEEDDVKTAIEPRIPRKKDIEWDGELTITKKEILDVFGIDEAARGEHVLIQKKEEIMDKNEEVPSMWDYDPRRLPKEFVGLEQDSFLMDPTKLNLCFLNKSILSKICSMVGHFLVFVISFPVVRLRVPRSLSDLPLPPLADVHLLHLLCPQYGASQGS